MALRRVLAREKSPAEKELGTINQRISNANFVLDSLQKESVFIKKEVQKQNETLAEVNLLLGKSESDMKEKKKAMLELDKQCDNLWVTYEKRKNDLKKLEEDIFKTEIKGRQELEVMSKNKSSELESLNGEKSFLVSEIQRGREELLLITSTVEDSQKKYNELDGEIKNRLTQSSVLDDIISKSKSEVNKLNDLVESVFDQLKNKTGELDKLESVISGKNVLIANKDKEVKELESKKISVKREIDDIKEQKLYLVKKEEHINELMQRAKELYKKAGIEINI